jgi:hypothetical protein
LALPHALKGLVGGSREVAKPNLPKVVSFRGGPSQGQNTPDIFQAFRRSNRI